MRFFPVIMSNCFPVHTVARDPFVVPYIANLRTDGRHGSAMVFILIQYRLFHLKYQFAHW